MNDKVSEIMGLLQQIVDMVDQADRPFFSSKKVSLDEEELVSILEQLRMSIPAEVDRAKKVLAERDSILAKAHTDAQNMVADAQEQERKILEGARAKEDYMTRESEISKQAESVAKELKARSEALAMKIKQEADEYAANKRAEADAYARQTRTGVLNYSDSCLQYIDGKLKNMNNLISSALASVAETRGGITAELAKGKDVAAEQEQ